MKCNNKVKDLDDKGLVREYFTVISRCTRISIFQKHKIELWFKFHI